VLPKQLHYFADAVSYVALHHPAALDAAQPDSAVHLGNLESAAFGEPVPAGPKVSAEVAKFFSVGWIADFRHDTEAETRLAIGRMWDQDGRVAAIRQASELVDHAPPNGLGINVFKEISEGTRNVTGPEWIRLFSTLHSPSGSA